MIKDLIKEAESLLKMNFEWLDEVSEANLERVLNAMRTNQLSDMHFNWNTGYGYDDVGRDTTEKIYASVMGTEDALVRPAIASGTHAINLMLMGAVLPNSYVLSITGKPYDTLEETFGLRKTVGLNLADIGVKYNSISLRDDGTFDFEQIQNALNSDCAPDYVYIQRSTGYSWRAHISVEQIDYVVQFIKEIKPNCIVLLDNCYGEFTEKREPRVDAMAGSLIKNPGGGIAVAGGYVAGTHEIIERVAARMTAPGVGREVGLMFGQTRSILQGLFFAPRVVKDAMKGALLFGQVFSMLGYHVQPKVEDSTGHIVQAIELKSKEKLLKFCEAIQKSSPVNSYVTPIPAPMPGYDDEVIMAAGAFVQGSSIEMSADAPVKEPYNVYYQGGICYEHVRIALKNVLEEIQAE